MSLRTVLVFAFVSLVFADVNELQFLEITDSRCKGDKWTVVDRRSSYASNFTGRTQICVRDYVDVCTGPTGLLPCNEFYGECHDVKYDWTDKELYPEVKTTVKPSICASNGAVMSHDTNVVAIAQVIFGFLMYLATFGCVVGVASKIEGGALATAMMTSQMIIAMILMFSFAYLNGLVTFAVSVAAVSLFRPRNAVLTAFGIALLMSAFFWTTYEPGLGAMQHNTRFAASTANANFYQDKCNSYYRGYFTFVDSLRDIDENPSMGPWGYCHRYWVASILFFQILSQMVLVLQAAAGIHALLHKEPHNEPKEISETEPAQ